MISVEKALSALNNNLTRGRTTQKPLLFTINKVLGNDIKAPIHLPPFSQSAMDGYAVKNGETLVYQLVGEIPAGCNKEIELKPGEAIRIFTGSVVPPSADGVVIQEEVEQDGTTIKLKSKPSHYDNIRRRGEQIKKGKKALKKGTSLTPAAIGFLASLGIDMIPVYQNPRISILVTGDELVPPGKKLQRGEIYESNSIQLASALSSEAITEYSINRIKDDYETTLQEIEKSISNNDIVILSGGISVGAYDFVGKALKNLGVEEVFFKVAQKPGKPTYFGKKNDTLIFALPGNPASCLIGFYIYVLPAIRHFMGYKNPHLERENCKILSSLSKKEGRALFLKAKLKNDNTVQILEKQSSAMLHTFSQADALVYLPPSETEIEEGTEVITILLPVRTNYIEI